MADHRKEEEEEEADWESDWETSEDSGDWESSEEGMSEDKESSYVGEDDRWSDFCRSPEQVPELRSEEEEWTELDAAGLERAEEERLEAIAHYYSSEDGGINEDYGGWISGTEFSVADDSEDRLPERPAPRVLPEAPVSKEQAACGACAVCKELFAVGERAAWLPCEHFFHGDCIHPWVAVKSTCPVCRYDLDDPSQNRLPTGTDDYGAAPQGAAPAPQQDTCHVCGRLLSTDDVGARQDAPDQQDTIPVCRCQLPADDVGARQGAPQQDTCPVCGRQLPTDDAGARQDAPQQVTILVCRCKFPTDDVGTHQGAPQKSGGGGDNVRVTTDEDYPMECSTGDEDGQQGPP